MAPAVECLRASGCVDIHSFLENHQESLDGFKGKSTGNHGFYYTKFLPSNIGLSCKFSHHPIL